MADEKTEQPTPKRLRDAREKGEVAKSQEIPIAAVVLGVSAYFIVLGPELMALLSGYISSTISTAVSLPFEAAWSTVAASTGAVLLRIIAPIVCIVIVCAALAVILQIGLLFSFKAAAPKLSNLNPKKWFTQVFSKKNAFDLLKNLTKILVLTIAVKQAVTANFRDLLTIPQADLGAMWKVMGKMMYDLIIYAIAAFCVIAVIDFIYTKMKFTKDHMMSHDEVKREFKDSEGDPMIKSKRKQLHQEMLSHNAVENTRKAKVLIVNPTHYAVALDYDPERTPLPVILAKGEGELARRMIAAAKEEGIPVMREPPLARALFSDGTENAFIPKDLLGPVAEVLRFVMQMQQQP
ncbi:MAG: type III secretion system export apparatus subunit SctU [Succinivibrionaceae bacterium]|nr:type III secretion system export apparatus subunit SctU [Succinivibrionaceae bacterium]